MNFELIASVFSFGLFLAMLVFFEGGRRIGRARLAHDPEGLTQGIGAAEGAVFGLLGLLLAFTFSGAASRFEERRHLITEEANAIGTAYLRIDLLPAATQAPLRDLFRRYVEVRAVAYSRANDPDFTQARRAEGITLQTEIWALAVAATQRPDAAGAAAMLLLPALNAVFDITTTRETAGRNHPPPIIFLMLAGLSLMAALLVGYDTADSKDRRWVHPVAFAFVMALALWVILDLEYPRLGLIRVDSADQLLYDVRRSLD